MPWLDSAEDPRHVSMTDPGSAFLSPLSALRPADMQKARVRPEKFNSGLQAFNVCSLLGLSSTEVVSLPQSIRQ